MKEKDLISVLEIENLSFPNPWHEAAFKGEIDNDEISFPYVVVHRIQQKVIGYIVLWQVNKEVQISNFALHPDFRRAGIGKAVIRQVLGKLRRGKAEYVILEVRPSNLIAQSLYSKLGFKVLGIRKDYYINPDEDAVLMGKSLK